jgi:hypothetical protein
MSNLEKAISSAFNQHGEAEQHINRWELKMAAAFANEMASHLDGHGMLTEHQKAVLAAAGHQYAADIVDGTVAYLEQKAGCKMDRSMLPGILTEAYLSQRVAAAVRTAKKSYVPMIEKRDEAMRKAALAAPLNPSAGPSLGIDLGQYAAERAKQFQLEDARAAVPSPARGGYVDPDADPVGVMAAGEATLAQAYKSHSKYPAKKGKR